jgi:O-antigen/teichoic acid export membrane protein
MTIRRQAIQGVVWSAVQSWGTALLGMLTFLVLARILEPDDFGLLALAFACIALLDILLRGGFGQAIVQRREITPAHLDTAFWLNVAVGVATATVAVAVAGVTANAFGQPDLAGIIRSLAVTLLISPLAATHGAILRRALDFKRFAVPSLLATAAGGAMGIGLALNGWGVWSLVGQQLAFAVTRTVALWISCPWRPGLQVSRQAFRDLFGFGAFVLGAALLRYVRRRSDALAIGFFLGPVALGYYAVGQRLLRMVLQMLTRTIGNVGFPTFSRLQHDHAQMRAAFYTTTRFTFLVACPAFFCLAILARDVVPVLFGPGWEKSIPVVQALAFLGIVQALSFFTSAAIKAAGRPSLLLQLLCLQSTANTIVILATVRSGIVAVAIAYTVAEYLLAPLRLWAVKKLIGIDLGTYLRNLRVALLSGLLMAATVAVAREMTFGMAPPGLLLVAYLVLGAAVYSVATILLAPALVHEIREMLGTAMPAHWRQPSERP